MTARPRDGATPIPGPAPGVLPPRTVTLVLSDAAGNLLGTLPAFQVPTPWWQSVSEVVAAARARFGVDVDVLRLLGARTKSPPDGGPVIYLAQVKGAVPRAMGPVPGALASAGGDHPLRAPYARPNGPARELAWANASLAASGTALHRAHQMRTWNLSAIWRLETSAGVMWLKCVPPFFAHEGAVVRLVGQLAPGCVPRLVAAAPGRLLLADVPGDDRYHAGGEELAAMVRMLVGIQTSVVEAGTDLLTTGLPDWRLPAMLPRASALVEQRAGELDATTTSVLSHLVDSLPARQQQLDACGLPDSLIHGDFHPGNMRGTAGRLAILDWGDSGLGHPLLDQAAFCERLEDHDREAVLGVWSRLWARAAPGSHPRRAARLLRPVAALRSAVVYQQFLDGIEPDEHRYHRDDPGIWLRRAAALAGVDRHP